MTERFGIGIDLGGTKIEASLVDERGHIIDRLRVPTNAERDADTIIGELAGIIKRLAAANRTNPISSIGIGVAGQVEKDTGVVIHAPNLRWHNVRLKERLADTFRMPVIVCNDVRAAAWGEWLVGAGKDYNSLVCVFVGTGIGGAIVCNGHMLDGYNNTAGEIGHMVTRIGGPLCTCGNRGCLEALAGGWAIQQQAQQSLQKDFKNGRLLLDLAGGDISNVTAATVVDAMLQGDAMARTIIDNVAEALIAGITSIINVIGPERVILGGGIIDGMPRLVDRIAAGVRKNALQAAIGNVTITSAGLRGDAGAVGASLLALRSL